MLSVVPTAWHNGGVGEYRLDLLGWFQFERLCQTLLTIPYGLAVETWGGSRDLGRDAYTEGSLRFPDPMVDTDGPFLFQAKFVEDAAMLGRRAITRLKGALAQEAKKLIDLQKDPALEWDPPRHYVLMTNVYIGAARRAEVVSVIKKGLPNTVRVHLLHEPEIEAMINGAPGVRLSFPQILSLRDLSGLLEDVVNRDLANRTQALLADAQELAAVFVPTRAHYRAVDTVSRYHFVVLTGPPEMGKTAIAKMLALAQATEGWDVVNCRGPSDFDRAFKQDQPEIYVADDAFGSTEYRPQVAEEWAVALPEILQRVDGRHWLVWTSRSAPLKKGLQSLQLQDGAERFPDPGKVLVDASDLTVTEKAMMLYRHAKAHRLSEEARAMVRAQAEAIVMHPHFTPLRVRRFVRLRLDALAADPYDLDAVEDAIEEELAEPTDSMDKSFAALGQVSKDFLVSCLDVRGELTLSAISDAYHRLRHGEEELAPGVVAHQLEEHFLRRL